MIEFIANKKIKLSKAVLLYIEDLSYSACMKLLRNSDIKVNGKRVNKDVDVNLGDCVAVYCKVKERDKFDIVFADENVLVINKKSGYTSESVFKSLQAKYSEIKFIHRLDRNTSGIMIFALNSLTEKELLNGFKLRKFEKKYLATVYGVPKVDNAILTAYLKKDANASLVKIYDTKINGSVQIKTGYRILEKYEDSCLLEVTLYTGKTHQIRAHLAHIGYFILGDGKYGDNRINKEKHVNRQMLSAYSLTLHFEQNELLYYLNNKTFTVRDL